MIRFIALGSTDLLAADGRPVSSVLAQPKRIGLLLHLVLGGAGGLVRRDALLALLWPEATEPKARNSLRQAIHQLRKALGEEALVTRGNEEVGIAPGSLWCDAAEFARLAGEGNLEEALGLYRGDLLAGLHVAEAPDFMVWLEAERVRLRRLALRSAGELAERRRRAGDLAGALGWARRAVALAPLEEEPARRLIELLEQAGDRGGAVAEFEALADRLGRELEVAPSAETQRLIAAIRAHPSPPPRHTPIPVPAPPAGTSLGDRAAPLRSRRAAVLGLLAIGLLGLGAAWPLVRQGHSGAVLDPQAVVVAPFRVSAADPGLGYLREGMVDLLATKLASGSTLVAADPRAVLGVWRQMAGNDLADLPPDDAARVARRLRAGRVLLGSVVGTPARLTLSARLLDVGNGAQRATANVVGPADSLAELIDRLATQLLFTEAREPTQQLAELASASLPAVQAYLAGRQASRAGDYQGALRHYAKATELDSGFALAWLWRADASDWALDARQFEVKQRALELRPQLTPGDAAFLDALVGQTAGVAIRPRDRVAAWERVVTLSPDRAEGWYGLGDVLFHQGTLLGVDSNFVRAEAAFLRAREYDSAYVAPLIHLVQIAIHRGDLAEMERRLRLFRALSRDGDLQDFLRWRVAVARGDSAQVAIERARFGEYARATLTRIATWSQLEGVGVGDGLRAAQLLVERANNAGELQNARALQLLLLGNAGRFEEYDRVLTEMSRSGGVPDFPLTTIANALYWDGDTVKGRALLDQWLARGDAGAGQLDAAWRLWRVQPLDSATLAGRLARYEADPRFQPGARIARLGIEVLRACLPPRPSTREAAHALEEEIERAQVDRISDPHFLLARCYEALGEPGAALRLMRRRPIDQWAGLPYLSTALRLEGKYALAVGDTASAIRAWRHYLALRTLGDSGVAGRTAAVRASLERLLANQRR